MKVVLLRNVNEQQNLSMKLYADRLSAALSGRVCVREYQPWSPPGDGILRRTAKPLQYFARYCRYPLAARRESADVFHIVDHAYAQLLACLPAERTIVTCHELMLLKLANGDGGRELRPLGQRLNFCAFHSGFFAGRGSSWRCRTVPQPTLPLI